MDYTASVTIIKEYNKGIEYNRKINRIGKKKMTILLAQTLIENKRGKCRIKYNKKTEWNRIGIKVKQNNEKITE